MLGLATSSNSSSRALTAFSGLCSHVYTHTNKVVKEEIFKVEHIVHFQAHHPPIASVGVSRGCQSVYYSAGTPQPPSSASLPP